MTVVRVRCPLGGFAPCVDDLCHGADTTFCGLKHGFDFCDHGYVPEACDEGCGEDDELVEPMTYRQALAERDEMR